MAELAYNVHKHSATKKTLFELLLGYQPMWPSDINPDPKTPAAEQQLTVRDKTDPMFGTF
jgi:hypothetical protein